MDIILYLILTLYIVKCYIYLLTIFQQNHYDYKKYLKSLKKYYLYKPYMYIYYLSYIILCFNNYFKYLSIFCIILILISFIFRNKYIIKLRLTKRIIRLLCTNSIIYIIFLIFTYKYLPISYIYPVLIPFIIILSNYINKPLEVLINRYYYQKASNKLINLPIYKIAIAGSFGKTSTKDIIYQILESKYNTMKTPASFNTLMGLSYTINNNNLNSLDFLILEMGAFRLNEIKKMTNLFKPNIRIITEIGMQHMSTFKTISNIISAKFEIISNIEEDDILILNYDNEYIRSYNLSNIPTKHIYTYGINYGSINAKNIIYLKNKLKFDLYIEDKFIIQINTPIITKSNISNILASYSVVYALNKIGYNISNKHFSKTIYNQIPSPHRMEYKNIENIHIYDDSYSSNINGFINACEVLNKQSGKKLIITPGIVDGGIYDTILNKDISKYIIDTFDEIYLINNKSSKIIEEQLILSNKEYFIYNKFIDAYNHILNKYHHINEEIYLLIENDLPDSFIER